MMSTSARLLRLLSLLQAHPSTGADLAGELGVSARTVRNDVEKLRELGYPVEAVPGVGGGYRLGAGGSLPPLLLDDDEAVAVAVALRTAAGGTVAGIEETAVRALAKLETVLPSRLRHRIGTLLAHTVTVPGSLTGLPGGATVDPAVLTALVAARRDHECLRVDLVDNSGATTRLVVEPYQIAHLLGRWYLAAYDRGSADWRVLRVDRLTPCVPNGPRFVPRPPPPQGMDELVAHGAARATWEFFARIRLHAPMEAVAQRLPRTAGTLTTIDARSCWLDTGADDPATLLRYLSMLDLDFSVHDSPELAAELRKLAGRYAGAVADGDDTDPPGIR
ncbi:MULTISPECIES: helix-turn-helix transcriptional regulator [unclassified Pseudonocardia]|uniref:helix-turn-helix transcriptional regulator n=1 Tax=unclassified Pseudonocardia TaxID=2619320 RepID=UPI001CF67866|nr:WYL domain-containing protein [Pseudonocardia sp. ICBG162]